MHNPLPVSVVSALSPVSVLPRPTLLDLAHLVGASMESRHSCRAYTARLADFLATALPLTRSGVQAYVRGMKDAQCSSAIINQSLAAIKKLVSEAEARALLDPVAANSIRTIHGVKQSGVRSGNWLTTEQAEQLLALPDSQSLSGIRDYALLSIMLSCGLRRSELHNLHWTHYVQRDGRYLLADILGKGGKIRTVPVPEWACTALDHWRQRLMVVATDYTQSIVPMPVFWSIRQGRLDQQLSESGIWWIVQQYAGKLGIVCDDQQLCLIRPHDLRRTMAKSCRKGGADIEQISAVLGHSSVHTTELYLGTQLETRAGLAATDKGLVRGKR